MWRHSIMNLGSPGLLKCGTLGRGLGLTVSHNSVSFVADADISYSAGVDLEEFHRIACASIGNDPPQKRSSDVMKQIWALPVSPGARSDDKRADRVRDWLGKLAALDGPARTSTKRRSTGETSPAKRARVQPVLRASNVPTPPPSSPKVDSPLPRRSRPENRPPDVLRSPQPPSPPSPEAVRRTPLTIPTPQTSPIRLPVARPISPEIMLIAPQLCVQPTEPNLDTDTSMAEVTPDVPIVPKPRSPKRKPLRGSKSLPHPAPSSHRDQERRKTGRRLRPSRSESTIPTLASLYTLARKPVLPNKALVPPKPRKAHSMSSVPLKSSLPVKTDWSMENALFYVQSSATPPSRPPAEYHSQRLGTLEGLLWGIGWGGAAMSQESSVESGFVFVDAKDETRLKNIIEALEDARPEGREPITPLYIFDSADLPYFYPQLSNTTRSIQPLWSSSL